MIGDSIGQRPDARRSLSAGSSSPRPPVPPMADGKHAVQRRLAPPTSQRPHRRLSELHARCTRSDVPELRRLARTIGQWHSEILAYFHQSASNGPTEAVNLLVKRVKRVGFGFRNFINYRYAYSCTAGSHGTLT